MPTYEYACTDCGQHVEVVKRISDEPHTVCGNCGGRLRRVFHPAGILLKGSGFYKTDSRAASAAKKEPVGASSSGSGSSGTDSPSGGSKGGEAKGGESKSGESKGGESKGGESKGGSKEKSA